MPLPSPEDLYVRNRHSREECIQALLASLIVAGHPPRWNTPVAPSPRGNQLLRIMAGQRSRSGATRLVRGVQFFSEFELPSRRDEEKAGWPDFAILTADRLTLIELKTEPSSHRPGQLAHYADLAAHHYPHHARRLVYLTPRLKATARPDPVPHRHIGWRTVTEGLRRLWDRDAPRDERATAAFLVGLLSDLHLPWAPAPAAPRRRLPPAEGRFTDDALDIAEAAYADDDLTATLVALATQVAADGTQRAVDNDWADPEQMEQARVALRAACRRRGLAAQPWIWRAATSGGRPLTDSGRRLGYELRVSRRS